MAIVAIIKLGLTDRTFPDKMGQKWIQLDKIKAQVALI
jgi:hypothetical protein